MARRIEVTKRQTVIKREPTFLDKDIIKLIKIMKKDMISEAINPIYICPCCKFKGHLEDFDYDSDACEMSCNKCMCNREPERLSRPNKSIKAQVDILDVVIKKIKSMT